MSKSVCFTAWLPKHHRSSAYCVCSHIGHYPRRYFMIFGGGALLFFGLPARPETSYVRAARDEAAKRLKEEGVI